LNLALTSARMGAFDHDLVSGTMLWDARMHQLFGVQPGSFSGKYDDFLGLVHIEDRGRLAGDGTHVELRFEVQDSGIGISGEAQTRLFKPFVQADGSSTRKYGGTGLGLAIAKQLVELMHGQIGVESTPGNGAIFWFTALFEKQAKVQCRVSDDRKIDLRVLVVQSSASSREILCRRIVGWKMQCSTAPSGEKALSLLRAAALDGCPFELVLMDLQMPEMDGWALSQVIKADHLVAATRLVVLAPLGKAKTARDLKELGIEACLLKPVKQSRLFECLTKATGTLAGKKAFAESGVELTSPFSEPDGLVKARILLAEDNGINQKVALGLLSKLGYDAEVVANGLDVLQALHRISYDVILMDCQMPEMDGYEAAQAIRQREHQLEPSCPWKSPVHIIALTAHALQGEREKCLAAGMNDYLSKPVRLSNLKAAFDRWKQTVQRQSHVTVV
jgi:two-component system, sensor histidine kinase and response regulator